MLESNARYIKKRIAEHSVSGTAKMASRTKLIDIGYEPFGFATLLAELGDAYPEFDENEFSANDLLTITVGDIIKAIDCF